MRVIAGKYRGRKFDAPEGYDTTRPTLDRVKEAMFSIIGFKIDDAVVLDLFSGSGNLGIEAISRGAKKVIFNDKDDKAIRCIKSNLKLLKIEEEYEVLNLNYLDAINCLNDKIDIVLLDPPYKNDIYYEVMKQINDKLSSYAIIVCEHTLELELKDVEGYTMKSYKYGNKKLSVYRKLN